MAGTENYDILIIGLGPVGVEAALWAGCRGARAAALGMSLDNICMISFTPILFAEGGDMADVGLVARALEEARYKVGFETCGGKVWVFDPRQARGVSTRLVEAHPRVDLFQVNVSTLIICEDGKIEVKGKFGFGLKANSAVLATGTFLGGRLKMGEFEVLGGRTGELPSDELLDSLRGLGFEFEPRARRRGPVYGKGSIIKGRVREIWREHGGA